ncbi:hypothetical protein NI17_009465 [Thermobifida halotolerans]|uniref:Uncharacterized protein n=1 Tax=Thermobifida halotolerans TaxID=483545 RepID=A0AA97M5N2_9ACTN|nr:hypothetical protein [Thermobifida halotolerans]UOE21326.1 hypothetical protein NI17_009465 [Thermobifida halotolerans]
MRAYDTSREARIGDVDAYSGFVVAAVGQHDQAFVGGRIPRQGRAWMRAAVRPNRGPRHGLKGPQRMAGGIGEEPHARTMVVLVRRIPHVCAAVVGFRAAGGGEDLAIQDDRGPALVAELVQDLAQLGSLGGQHVDAFVRLPVGGDPADGVITGRGGDAAAATEPAQHQQCLTNRSQCPGPAGRAKSAAMSGQQASQVGDHGTGNIKHGRTGNHREASGPVDAVLW